MKARIVKQSFDKASDRYIVQQRIMFFWITIAKCYSIEAAMFVYDELLSKKINKVIIKTSK